MFCLNDTMRYYLCPGRTDMRKGISSLCGVVHEKMGGEVRNGDVFIFIGSSRKLMKLLHAEDGGMVMYVKRLEAGRFKLPAYDEQSKTYPIREFGIRKNGNTQNYSMKAILSTQKTASFRECFQKLKTLNFYYFHHP